MEGTHHDGHGPSPSGGGSGALPGGTSHPAANLTRRDGEELLALAPTIPVTTRTTEFPLTRANEALSALRNGELYGAAVLVP